MTADTIALLDNLADTGANAAWRTFMVRRALPSRKGDRLAINGINGGQIGDERVWRNLTAWSFGGTAFSSGAAASCGDRHEQLEPASIDHDP